MHCHPARESGGGSGVIFGQKQLVGDGRPLVVALHVVAFADSHNTSHINHVGSCLPGHGHIEAATVAHVSAALQSFMN